MFLIGQAVEITNHSEPSCDGQMGEVLSFEYAYDGTRYYVVRLYESDMECSCTDDELMEG